MAVGRLSGAWIWQILRDNYPDGVVRRVLLDQFAALLVSSRSSKGAKGRLARRLYARLAGLQRRGFIIQEEGIVRPRGAASRPPKAERMPVLGVILQKRLFLALMAEDRNSDGGNAPRLHEARWDFLARATEDGWTLLQAATALGITQAKALEILAKPPARA